MTKEQLRAYRAIRLERDKLLDMLRELETTIYSPAIPKLDPAPGGGQGEAVPEILKVNIQVGRGYIPALRYVILL